MKALKRKAWRYQKRKLPGWSDLLGSDQERRQFIRAWCLNPVSHVMDLLGHYLLKCLPVDACSAVGGWLGPRVMKYKYPAAVMNMRHNLGQIHPDWDAARIEAAVKENCQNLGRFMSEFSVIDRICRNPERVSTTGLDKLLQAAQDVPVILVTLHLGNWEVLPSLTRRCGLAFHTFFLPLSNPVEAWIAYRTRRRLGAKLLPLAMDGVRPALKILRQGGMVALFCDEAFAGRIRGPFLGRTPHLSGNTALAVRLARLCLVYSERVRAGGYFNCHFGPVMKVGRADEHADPSASLMEEVVALNAMIESAIIAHTSQWYFLNEKL